MRGILRPRSLFWVSVLVALGVVLAACVPGAHRSGTVQQTTGAGSVKAANAADTEPVTPAPYIASAALASATPADTLKVLSQPASTEASPAASQHLSVIELGTADGLGGAAATRVVAPFAFRYQYLAGGANTGQGWATWNADGSFVTNYVQESFDNGMVPVFSYYMLLQSSPGAQGGEDKADLVNLQNAATMTAYYNDLKLLFQRAAEFPDGSVILHVEPDLWGFLEQQARDNRASSVPAQVAATGLPELAGLPDSVDGFAQAVKRLRDIYAPNVLLGYHLSPWASGEDILYSKPADGKIVSDARKAAAFYQSLGAPFDLVFTDASDRDAAFKQYQYHDGGAAWWNADDYRRNAEYLSAFHTATPLPIIIWQLPLGNTKMRTENNTWEHYQDNHVETLIGDPSRAALQAYANAGVVALLFGRGADGPTCACDAANDGVTNPAPINGNTGMSLSADDDGGYFRQQAAAYYQAGGLPLP